MNIILCSTNLNSYYNQGICPFAYTIICIYVYDCDIHIDLHVI